MTLTPRRRIVVLFALGASLGPALILWWWVACKKLTAYLVDGSGAYAHYCTFDWRDFGNGGCGGGHGYHPVLGWVEVLGGIALLPALGWLLARWVLRPLRAMTETIARLGPASLGLRLATTGPRDETRRLSEAIDALLDRVNESYESQRRFAANASHELRTPLATQRALIEVSLADPLTPEQLRLLTRQLLATNERNEALVEGLLALAETEQGLLAHTPLRLDAIAADVLERLRVAADKAGVRLDLHVQEVTVVGERPLLDRMITNLVQNAIKYNGPEGTLTVRVAPPACIVVSNTGPVVPAEAVDGLFEPFRRLSGERLEHGGGAGLGLTIVRSIVAAHGGSLSATANPGGGLTVTVDLPVPYRAR